MMYTHTPVPDAVTVTCDLCGDTSGPSYPDGAADWEHEHPRTCQGAPEGVRVCSCGHAVWGHPGHDGTPDGHEHLSEDVAGLGCPACGQPSDYCQGHGEIGDPVGFTVLELHDADEHDGCHPDGCLDAPR